jgi:hypothetical protein
MVAGKRGNDGKGCVWTDRTVWHLHRVRLVCSNIQGPAIVDDEPDDKPDDEKNASTRNQVTQASAISGSLPSNCGSLPMLVLEFTLRPHVQAQGASSGERPTLALLHCPVCQTSLTIHAIFTIQDR